jgi:hypothetical protein
MRFEGWGGLATSEVREFLGARCPTVHADEVMREALVVESSQGCEVGVAHGHDLR